jgi:hypothetical protein
MAARRLLIVMLVLLGLSTLAAALIPPQALREGTSSTSTTEETETTPADTVPARKALPKPISVTVGGNTIPVLSCPASLRRARRCKPLRVGDQFTLKVRSKRADEVEMPRFGLIDIVEPNKPARFEILATSAGSYNVRFVSTGRIAARVVVEKPSGPKTDKKKPAKKKRAKSRAPGESGRS